MANEKRFDNVQLAADTNWQIAKGYLNAVLAVQGACYTPTSEGKYEKLKHLLEGFIAEVESEELNL